MSWDDQIAARTIWAEARGEPEDGQSAVAHVLWNRLRDGRWGKSLATVCLSPMQFSCWNASDGQRVRMAALPEDDVTLRKMLTVLFVAERWSPDPSGGALYYFADTIQPPSWAAKMKFLVKIGHHSFFTDKP